jgi:ATP-dependent helicase/nuclease subunit A
VADLSSLFTLSRSAVVQAGAGTGKTHSLITLCLHLLGGIGRAEPVPPARLWAVTFTEKAAAELRARLRQRVDRLAEAGAGGPEGFGTSRGELPRLEPELARSCEAEGRAFPEQAIWQRARRDLGLAQIDTIHSLCSQILRRHAAAAGLDPSFALLDELEARSLAREACEAAVLDALEGGPLEGAARRLCAELGFSGVGKFSRGLADELQALLRAIGESGRSAVALVDSTVGLSEPLALSAEAQARSGLLRAIDTLEACASVPGKRGLSSRAAATVPLCAEFRGRLWPAIARAPVGELHEAAAAVAALEKQLSALGQSKQIAEEKQAAEAAVEALLEADAHVRACRLSRDLAALSEQALSRYRERKKGLGALDFDDLTRLTRDLLANDPAARRSEKARIAALLVDEFQDTSRAQLELFGWLAEGEGGEGTAPAGSGLPGARPVAQGTFVAVGDRKQSIYEFRGADVAGAQQFAGAALQDGAELYRLRESRRSRPALVSFGNLLFARVLAQADRPFDTPFVPGEDDLLAHRPSGPPGACAELVDVGGGVDDEADAVGNRLAQLLAPGAPERVFERSEAGEAGGGDGGNGEGGNGEAGGGSGAEVGRPIRGGDVAILLRTFTHVEAFRRALLARRIPHLVLKGRSFREAREVADLVALLSLALDPDDRLALATVLRSPLGPISDDGLVLLSRGPRSGADGTEQAARRLDRRALTDPLALRALAPDDAAAVARIGRIVAHLKDEADRLGPAALLEAALAESDYVAAAAGGLFGEQAAANLDKLLSLARAHELRGGNLRGFLNRMQALEDGDGTEADAAVVEERDPHAVRLLTVHAAKGLEFPVVFIPECAQIPRPPWPNLLLDHDLGLALKVRGADGERRWGPHGNRICRRKNEREEAQGRRLLYVAATRARDRVIFSARAPPRNGETWRGFLSTTFALPEAEGLARVIAAGSLAAPPLPARRALVTALDEIAHLGEASPPGPARVAARSFVARVAQEGSPPSGPAGAAQGTLVAPVTQLADAMACPERYHLLHEVGLEERPGSREFPAVLQDLRDGDEPAHPATERGTLAHRLLELAPLGLPDASARRAALRALLAQEGEDPDAHEAVVEACTGFLGSPLAQRMARAEAQHLRLHREHPFALRLAPRPGDAPGPALLLRGQLDALLLDEGAATVIDYKHAERRDPERYAAQLDAYALAARALVGDALPVRSGLVFLRTAGAPFVERPAATPDALAQTERRLLEAGRAIAAGRRAGVFPKVGPRRCKELGCGFILRCHPGERGAAARDPGSGP